MDEVLQEFNTLNQLNLQAQHLFCANCKKWLPSDIHNIYQHSDSKNYCKNCSAEQEPEEEFVKSRNFTLGEILEKCKYYCKFNECHFVGLPNEVKEHEQICLYAYTRCPLCSINKKRLYNTEIILEHLAAWHSEIVTALTIEKPVVDINLKVLVDKTQVFIINLADTHTFIMFVEHAIDMLECKVVSKVHPSLLSNQNYIIQYEADENKITANGRIKSFRELITNYTGNPKIHFLPIDKYINLKVYLCGYELVQNKIQNKITDCSICLKELTADLYQCVNGHCVCQSCSAKNCICPTCGVYFDHRVITKHLLTNYYLKCVNAREGCLQLSNPTDLTTHLADCAYVKVFCEVCKESHLKLNIMKHILDKHQVLSCIDTISFIQLQNQLRSRNEYVRFRSLVFQFSIATNYNGNDVTLDCNAILLHCSKVGEAAKYSYEVQLLQPGNDSVVLFKLSNLCQTNAGGVKSSANLNLFKKFLKGNNEHLTFNCRLIISRVAF